MIQHPGATENLEDPHPDYQGVAWHYGNPLGEQRHFDTGGAVIDRSNRSVISITGPDAGAYLHSLLSQHFAAPEEATGTEALNLDAQGRVLHHVGITQTEDGWYLDVAPSQVESLLEYLQRMVFWNNVEIAVSPLRQLTVLGNTMETAEVQRHSRVGSYHQQDIFTATPQETFDELVRSGLKPAGLMAYTAARVRAVIPEQGIDLDEKTIPHESAHLMAQAVHLNKGCYRGQETVARVENLGRAPRALVLLHLDGSAPQLPVTGAEITAAGGGRALGRIGTVVHDYEYGPIALGLVKHSALGRALEAEGVAITVDPDSVPRAPEHQAGREAITRFRAQET